MKIDFKKLSARDKAVLMGLFLSRFDKEALDIFGFSTFRQAYNVLGFAIGCIPKSIQNYRDEFDPFFPNPRKGWRNRKLRDYCKEIKDATQNMSFDELSFIINGFLDKNIINEEDIRKGKRVTPNESVAKRLITGKSAEEYFVMNYQSLDVFNQYVAEDTTLLGCGFDFKLSHGNQRYYVEVKGINEKYGNILMTEKEFQVADDLRELYCLFIVSNFRLTPEHQLFFNPLYNPLIEFHRQEQLIRSISYSGSLQK